MFVERSHCRDAYQGGDRFLVGFFRAFVLQGYARACGTREADSTNHSPIYRSTEKRGEERVTSYACLAYASKAARPGCVRGRSAEISVGGVLIWKANAE